MTWHSRAHVAGMRRGTAIVAALGLVVLAAALLASAAEVAAGTARRNRADVAALFAESAARRALATALDGWSTAYDSLAIGRGTNVALRIPGGEAEVVPYRVIVRVRRLDSALYAVTVDATAGVAPLVARRRVRLVVTTRAAAGRASGPDVRPIPQWSLADLY